MGCNLIWISLAHDGMITGNWSICILTSLVLQPEYHPSVLHLADDDGFLFFTKPGTPPPPPIESGVPYRTYARSPSPGPPPPPPISGGKDMYLLSRVLVTIGKLHKTPSFPGFLGKSSQDYTKKNTPLSRANGNTIWPPYAFEWGGGGLGPGTKACKAH